MKNFFKKISLVILLTTFLIGASYATAAVTYKIPTPIALFEDSLSNAITSSSTSFTLVRGTDIVGTSLATSTYGFIIDEGSSSQEFVLADCTATACTNAIRGVSPITGLTSVTSLQKAHRRGAVVKMTDAPILLILKRLLNGDETIPNKLSYASAPTFTTATDIATKGYVDSSVGAGCGNADTSSKGCVEIATQAEVDAGTQLGGTGAYLATNPALTRAKQYHDYAVDAVGTDAYAITITPAITSYIAGDIFSFKAGVFNTGAATLNVSGLGAKTIRKNTVSDLETGDILTGQIVVVEYDGTYMQLVSRSPLISNTISASASDQSQATQDATTAVGEANSTTKRYLIAESFIPSKQSISAVKLYKSANTGTFSGTVKVAIQADSAGSPSGSDLVAVTLTNAQYTALATGEFNAQFATDYTSLAIGSLYWIVVTPSTNDTSNHPNLGTNSAGGYTSGTLKYNNTTDGWVAVSTVDLYFKTIEGIQNKIVKTGSDGYVPMAMNQPQRAKTFPYIATYATSGATSTVTITHSLGQLPTYIKMSSTIAEAPGGVQFRSTADGVATVSASGTPTYYSIYGLTLNNATASGSGTSTSALNFVPEDLSGGGTANTAVTITKVSEDIVELTFTKTGTPNNNMQYLVEISL